MKHLLLCFLFTSCSSIHEERSYAKKYEEAIFHNRCETAQKNIPLEKDNSKYMRFYQGTMGYMISIPMLSATTFLDLLLLGRCRYGCAQEERKKKALEVLLPTTTWTYESTKDLRCPDNSYYVNKFIEVANCYERRGDKVSLEKANEQLTYLNDAYEEGPTCIRIRDAQILKQQLKRVESKLSGSW